MANCGCTPGTPLQSTSSRRPLNYSLGKTFRMNAAWQASRGDRCGRTASGLVHVPGFQCISEQPQVMFPAEGLTTCARTRASRGQRSSRPAPSIRTGVGDGVLRRRAICTSNSAEMHVWAQNETMPIKSSKTSDSILYLILFTPSVTTLGMRPTDSSTRRASTSSLSAWGHLFR